jgi:hypothetical protein
MGGVKAQLRAFPTSAVLEVPPSSHWTGGWMDLRGSEEKDGRACSWCKPNGIPSALRPTARRRYTTELPRRLSLMTAAHSSFPPAGLCKTSESARATNTATRRSNTFRCQEIIHWLKKEIRPGPGPTYRPPVFQTSAGLLTVPTADVRLDCLPGAAAGRNVVSGSHSTVKSKAIPVPVRGGL